MGYTNNKLGAKKMNNDQMKAGRILKMQEGKRLFNRIMSTLKAGGVVFICTYRKAVKITAKHESLLKLGKSGSVYMKSGKNWVCIDYCEFQFSR